MRNLKAIRIDIIDAIPRLSRVVVHTEPLPAIGGAPS